MYAIIVILSFALIGIGNASPRIHHRLDSIKYDRTNLGRYQTISDDKYVQLKSTKMNITDGIFYYIGISNITVNCSKVSLVWIKIPTAGRSSDIIMYDSGSESRTLTLTYNGASYFYHMLKCQAFRNLFVYKRYLSVFGHQYRQMTNKVLIYYRGIKSDANMKVVASSEGSFISNAFAKDNGYYDLAQIKTSNFYISGNKNCFHDYDLGSFKNVKNPNLWGGSLTLSRPRKIQFWYVDYEPWILMHIMVAMPYVYWKGGYYVSSTFFAKRDGDYGELGYYPIVCDDRPSNIELATLVTDYSEMYVDGYVVATYVYKFYRKSFGLMDRIVKYKGRYGCYVDQPRINHIEVYSGSAWSPSVCEYLEPISVNLDADNYLVSPYHGMSIMAPIFRGPKRGLKFGSIEFSAPPRYVIRKMDAIIRPFDLTKMPKRAHRSWVRFFRLQNKKYVEISSDHIELSYYNGTTFCYVSVLFYDSGHDIDVYNDDYNNLMVTVNTDVGYIQLLYVTYIDNQIARYKKTNENKQFVATYHDLSLGMDVWLTRLGIANVSIPNYIYHEKPEFKHNRIPYQSVPPPSKLTGPIRLSLARKHNYVFVDPPTKHVMGPRLITTTKYIYRYKVVTQKIPDNYIYIRKCIPYLLVALCSVLTCTLWCTVCCIKKSNKIAPGNK